MATITPTVRLRRLGTVPRELREAAGLTLEEAASLLLRSPSSLSRVEKGLHAPAAARPGVHPRQVRRHGRRPHGG